MSKLAVGETDAGPWALLQGLFYVLMGPLHKGILALCFPCAALLLPFQQSTKHVPAKDMVCRLFRPGMGFK